MGGVVGIGRGDADEQVLVGFAGQQIAVLQRLLAEIGQQRIAAVIDLDRIDDRRDALRVGVGGGLVAALLAVLRAFSVAPWLRWLRS